MGRQYRIHCGSRLTDAARKNTAELKDAAGANAKRGSPSVPVRAGVHDPDG